MNMTKEKINHYRRRIPLSANKLRGNTDAGFSLVELIIVIAIMAILVGIIVPSLINYVYKSQKVADEATADSIGTTTQYMIYEAGTDPVSTEIGNYIAKETCRAADLEKKNPASYKYYKLIAYCNANPENPAYATG